MARQAQIRIDIATGRLKVTDEHGNNARKLSRKQKKRFQRDPGTYIATATIFKQSNPHAERTCIIVVIGGTEYKICM